MAVVIRLSRAGTKKKPFYHIVAADKIKSRDGKYLERLGCFNPRRKGHKDHLVVDRDQIQAWVTKGAVMSETVGQLLENNSK
ncbi:MAG TPA: 30S ribosomal protein S16 [Oligoflexia bacterium]|nr:30S ribosomal protein S16 [Oligoflexia bacterium]